MPSDSKQPDSAAPAGGLNVSQDPDVELLRQARSGEALAFGALVRKHQDAIYGLTVRMVGEAATAEELTQDTFLRAWRNLGGFRGEARVSTWLYRIAVNLCLDHLGSRQTRQRRRETGLDAPGEGPHAFVAHQPGPDEQLEEQEVTAAFQQALDDLDPDHRAAFLLRHQEGLASAEIAAALGISPANAKVRVHRARQMILTSLRRLGFAV
jgi:RNA polymerase sigma-70 factor (ECF subfamily)